MRKYFDAGDYNSSEGKTKLDEEIDSLLADDRRWKAPNWKRRYQIESLIGALVGAVLGFLILYFFIW